MKNKPVKPEVRPDTRRKTPKKALQDVAWLHGPTEDGEGARVLRLRNGELSAGEVRPAREGQSIAHQELVRLRPIHPELPVCEVEVLHAPPQETDAARDAAGPVRASNPRYRRNWNAIFGSPTRKAKPDRDFSVN